jgi:hypothetical protein
LLPVSSAVAQEKISGNDRVAIVNSNGKLESGVGIVSTDRISTGEYEVITDRKITKCACLVTRGSPKVFITRSGYAVCFQREASAGKGFVVRLFNEIGDVEDGEFMLLAACTN